MCCHRVKREAQVKKGWYLPGGRFNIDSAPSAGQCAFHPQQKASVCVLIFRFLRQTYNGRGERDGCECSLLCWGDKKERRNITKSVCQHFSELLMVTRMSELKHTVTGEFNLRENGMV